MVQEVWFFHGKPGYTKSEYDHCLYFKKLNDIFIILVLYVNDILIVSDSMDEINKLKAQMARTFDMKDLGDAKQILGIEIHRDRKNGKLSFSQEKYVEKIIERFEMKKEKYVNFPWTFLWLPILKVLQVYVLVVLKKGLYVSCTICQYIRMFYVCNGVY